MRSLTVFAHVRAYGQLMLRLAPRRMRTADCTGRTPDANPAGFTRRVRGKYGQAELLIQLDGSQVMVFSSAPALRARATMGHGCVGSVRHTSQLAGSGCAGPAIVDRA